MSSNNETVEPPTREVEDLKLENGDTAPSQTQTTTTESSKSPIPPDSPQRQPSTGSFEEHFKAFAKFGDPKSDGKQITLSNSDKWMKQAKVIDGKKITTTDTGIYFKKFKSQKLGIVDYKKFLEDLAKNKKVELEEIKNKMAGCGPPGHHGIGAVKSAGAVDRLTDTSKYTGTHKQRFDGTGKGKGIVGRKDIADTSGYVTGYQNKDSFGKAEEK